MHRAIVVRGSLIDPSHIDLDEPVPEIRGPVVVTVRPVRELASGSPLSVLQAMCALTDLEAGDVDELERVIDAGEPPTRC
jgi:hypothetical protein